ncbi:MAG: hypothetical protein ACPG77_16205, partial [Nannocystaceae bacterium]
MPHSPFDLPGVAVGFALFVGALSQVLATHLKIPGIVLLLLAGVLLGPDVADIIRPAALGGGLNVLVGDFTCLAIRVSKSVFFGYGRPHRPAIDVEI